MQFACMLVFATSTTIDLTPADFDKVVDGSKHVLVQFYAPWYVLIFYPLINVCFFALLPSDHPNKFRTTATIDEHGN